MRREEFVSRHARSWSRLEDLLRLFESRRVRRPATLDLREDQPDPAEFDVLYRRACRHLALARHREYGDDLTTMLNDLALRSYRHLYGARRGFGATFARLVLGSIPATIRSRWRSVALAAAAFLLPMAGMALAVIVEPSLVHTVQTGEEIRGYERMYDPASTHFARERPSDGDLEMFGYYVANNIGIAFTTFAWGLAGGVGALLILVLNGVGIGATMGHLAGIGYGSTFFPFVAGHSAFELSAIILAGAAGLELGWSVLAPGRLTRGESLRRAGRRGVDLVGGATVLLVLAAFVEAYWSPRALVAPAWKYGVGALLWMMVCFWIVRAPRHGP